MAERERLSDKAAKAKTKRGRYSDGGGLFLNVTKDRYKLWEFIYRIRGKRRTMGLGSYPKVSLKDARLKRDEARKLLDAGTDPIAARGQKRQATASAVTVMEALDAYLTVMEPEWKTERYPEQIRARLETYVGPIIGDMSIADIQLPEIERVLVPIWTSLRPTSDRIRMHLEGAINWAIAKKVRTDQSNPAEVKRLRFSLSFADRKVAHYPSLPYADAPRFLSRLRAQDGVKARALEFVMLNAVRVADICGGGKAHSEPMKWSHVDLPAALWTIPDTKMGRPHVVPLSNAAMRVLGEMRSHPRSDPSGFVFPGSKYGSVISDATLRYLLQAMGYAGIATTHGMRATFRTWASETTDYPKDVIEMALAHAQGELDRAYMRGALLDKRRRLMSAWADYLEGRDSKVIALRA